MNGSNGRLVFTSSLAMGGKLMNSITWQVAALIYNCSASIATVLALRTMLIDGLNKSMA